MIIVSQNVNVLVIYPGGDTNEMHKRYNVETAENIKGKNFKMWTNVSVTEAFQPNGLKNWATLKSEKKNC